MDPSKPGKGILASLEHKGMETPRRAGPAAPSSGRGAALFVCGGVLVGALVAWWLASGPSPVIVQEALPPMAQAARTPAVPAVELQEAAAIVDEAPSPAPTSPPASSRAPAATPTPISTVARMRHDRVAKARPLPRPKQVAKAKAKQAVAAHGQARRTPPVVADTDVVLLSALVAHADGRDVVEPRTGDRTENLLERCRRVGGEEGRLCRVRICATRVDDGGCRTD